MIHRPVTGRGVHFLHKDQGADGYNYLRSLDLYSKKLKNLCVGCSWSLQHLQLPKNIHGATATAVDHPLTLDTFTAPAQHCPVVQWGNQISTRSTSMGPIWVHMSIYLEKITVSSLTWGCFRNPLIWSWQRLCSWRKCQGEKWPAMQDLCRTFKADNFWETVGFLGFLCTAPVLAISWSLHIWASGCCLWPTSLSFRCCCLCPKPSFFLHRSGVTPKVQTNQYKNCVLLNLPCFAAWLLVLSPMSSAV